MPGLTFPAQSPPPESPQAPIYGMAQFEADMAKMRPRAFDIYFLGPFMAYFAIRSKKSMGKWTRRLLFTAGIYTIYRNWTAYKTLPQTIAALISAGGETATPPEEPAEIAR